MVTTINRIATVLCLATDSDFVSVFNRKSVPRRQGRFCVLTSLSGSMDGARNHWLEFKHLMIPSNYEMRQQKLTPNKNKDPQI